MKDYSQRWEVIRQLGQGGQGKVSLVRDKQQYNSQKVQSSLKDALGNLTAGVYAHTQDEAFKQFTSAILQIQNSESNKIMGALKELHIPLESEEAKTLRERMMREIKAIKKVNHPHTLVILDEDSAGNWFVAKYYPQGNLKNNKDAYKGNVIETLTAIRPIAEAVAMLHEQDVVHRDIKTNNIFVDIDGSLVLGDFGIAFFTDEDKTRRLKLLWAALIGRLRG